MKIKILIVLQKKKSMYNIQRSESIKDILKTIKDILKTKEWDNVYT